MRIILAIMAAVFAATAWAGFGEGFAAYDKGDYVAALREFRPLAEQGHAGAQYVLGVSYGEGQGVPQDYKQAVYWYRKAAEQGQADAQNSLGVSYAKGQGVPQDYKQAVYWYGKAAEQGRADAQYNLGVSYDNGRGVPQQDYQQAVYWYRKAAEQGYANAQYNLGVHYGEGLGVSRDVVLACMLYNLAAVGGNAGAANNRSVLSRSLTPRQLEEGQALAAKWKPGMPLPIGTKTGAQAARSG